MTGLGRKLLDRLFGGGVPAGFTGTLAADERVVASAALRDGGHLVATSLGLWVTEADRPRRVGWHLISKATWGNGVLVLVEARETETAGDAVLLADLRPSQFRLEQPGKLPDVVHDRVTSSIRSRHHKELPGGGAWFVQRKVPGQDGVVLQVRPDEGTDLAVVRRIAAQVAATMRETLQ